MYLEEGGALQVVLLGREANDLLGERRVSLGDWGIAKNYAH